MGEKLKKLRKLNVIILFTLVLLMMNITKVIYLSEKVRFNMAFSDTIVIFALIYILYIAFKEKSLTTIKGLPIWLSLVLWITFVGYLGIRSNEIIDSGWLGVIEEIVKTGLCIIYFIVGYNTLRVLSYSAFKIHWTIATFIFIFGGIVIYLLASKGIYYWNDEPKYIRLFMGTDTDPNHAATYLTISFFAMGLFAFCEKSKSRRMIYFAILSMSILGILFTGSRGGLIGFLIGLLILLVYFFRKNWKLAVNLICVLMIMGLLFVQVDMSFSNGKFTQKTIYKLIDFEMGLDERWSLGYTALQMGNDYPLTGVGRGNYKLNSAPYYEKYGYPLINDIPHNTFWGLYAEVGIIGLLLFFMPFWMILYSAYRRYKGNKGLFYKESEGIIWLIGCIFAVGVQAFVLNVENRRFLWYLAGVLVFLFDSNATHFTINHSYLNKKVHRLTYALVIFMTFSYVIISNNANISSRAVIVKGNDINMYQLELPINAIELNQENFLGLNIVLGVNNEKSDRIKIKIIQTNEVGQEIELFSRTYEGISGQVFLPFTPNEEAYVVSVQIKNLDETLEKYTIKLLSIITNDFVYELERWYFLQPNAIANVLINNRKIALEDYIPKTDLGVGLESVFSNNIEVVKVDYEFIEVPGINDKLLKQTHLNVTYILNEPVSEDYTFVLSGFPFDLENIDDNRISIGYEGYSTLEKPNTSTWVAGEPYTVTYVIPKQVGVFKLMNGIRVQLNDKWEHLHVHEGTEKRNVYLDIGWINLNELSLMD